MAIRFACPVCGRGISVGREGAGRKGRCRCGAVVDVPAEESVRFYCPACQRKLEVPRALAGRQGRCPQCKGVVVIPAEDGAVAAVAAAAEPAVSGRLGFACTACLESIEVGPESAGRIVVCPKCGDYTMAPDLADVLRERSAAVRRRREAEAEEEAALITGKAVCPSCDDLLADDARVCVGCGVYIHSGRPILTAREMDEELLHARARRVVSPVSWLIPFGVYPVYSEAIGRHRPVAVWVIAAVTVLVSAWFLGLGYSGSPAMRSAKQLMLWAGKGEPEPERIAAVYEFTNYGDAEAFAAKREELRGTVADAELDRATLAALGPRERCFGEFRWAQLVTHAFLHGGILHLAGNMLFLLIFGSRVGTAAGNVWTPVTYLLLAVAAAGTQMAMSATQPPTAMLGASGAVMGMAGMYLVLFPMHRVFMAAWWRWGLIRVFHLSFGVFALRGFWVVLFYIAFDVAAVSLTFEDGTAHWAHLGGFVGGIAAGLGLLAGRQVYSGGDVLSLALGRYAWGVIGRPCGRE